MYKESFGWKLNLFTLSLIVQPKDRETLNGDKPVIIGKLSHVKQQNKKEEIEKNPVFVFYHIQVCVRPL